MPAPRFLQALDNVLDATSDAGELFLARCPVWGCESLLELRPRDGEWWLFCHGPHTHEDIVGYLNLHDLRVDTRPAERAWLALRLALTPDAWAGLILGKRVQPQAIDRQELRRLRKAGLWE